MSDFYPKFKKGDKIVVVNDSICLKWGASEGDIGCVDENDSSAPFVKFSFHHYLIAIHEDHMQLMTGKESELEKLLLWKRVSK